MKSKSSTDISRVAMITSLLLAVSGPLQATGFGAGIAPSRFELRAKPGAVVRDTIMIVNSSELPTQYALHTADWRLRDDSGVEYVEQELLDGSCRPWVRLERRLLNVPANGERRYRFEIHVPEDASSGLCKFAIIVQPGDSALAKAGANDEIQFPVVGRYAVTVYVTIGDAKPEIEFLGLSEQYIGDLKYPALRLKNNGNTYDRAFGQIAAKDAGGTRYQLVASTFPVLPGRTETILLSPDRPADAAAGTLSYPIDLKGRFEIGGETFRVDVKNWGADTADTD